MPTFLSEPFVQGVKGLSGLGDYVIDTIYDPALGITYEYYDTGAVSSTDANGVKVWQSLPGGAGSSGGFNMDYFSNPVYSGSGGGGGGVTAVNSETDSYGNTIVTYSDGSQKILNAANREITAAQESQIAQQQIAVSKIASSSGGMLLPDGSVNIPGVLSNPTVKNILDKLAQSGGQWVARQVGGNTILTRQNGGIGTMNIKSLLLPAAIIAGLFILGKGK